LQTWQLLQLKGGKKPPQATLRILTAAEVRALINVADGANNYVHRLRNKSSRDNKD
jgi:hypothetical protein